MSNSSGVLEIWSSDGRQAIQPAVLAEPLQNLACKLALDWCNFIR